MSFGISSVTPPCLVAAFSLCFILPAFAAAAEQNADDWDVSLGAGVASMPKYPGSDSQRTRALPLVSVKYGAFFLGGDSGGTGTGAAGLGVNFYQDEHWRVGAIASFGLFKARKESDDPHLHGLGDIDGTPRLGGFASYTLGWIAANASVSTDVGGNHQGTLADLGLTARWRALPQLTFSAGPHVTWASNQYMQTFFGVDEAQSAASGLPVYTAKGGATSIGFGVGANYRFDPHWSVRLHLSGGQLQGDAKNSPITQDKTQNSVALFAAYQF